MRRSLSCVLGLLLLSSALTARADDPAVEQAKAHFARAQKHFKLGRFEAALTEYSKAYEAKALPAFLFNIGQCHRKLGRFEKAVFFYRSYLRDMPSAPNRALVQELIAKSEEEQKALETRQAEAARRLQEAERARLEAETQRARLEAEKARLEAERQAAWLKPPPRPRPVPEKPAYRKAWVWAVIGSVAAAAIAGGVAAGVAIDRGGTRTVLPTGTLGTIDFRTTQ